MKVMLAIFVTYFIFFSPIESNKGLKKVLSIVKDIKENMINVDDVVDALTPIVDDVVDGLTPIIENKCGCCNEKLLVRKNVSTLSIEEYEILNTTLGKMKDDGNVHDWKSFENVANYHGMPFMCDQEWIKSYPYGLTKPEGGRTCCVHYKSEPTPFPYFAAWHRLLMVNFESSLRSFGGSDVPALPFWDWTEVTYTETGLPLLAEKGEWKNGNMKGKSETTKRGDPAKFFLDPAKIQELKTRLKNVVYCTKSYANYDLQSQGPHDTVHNKIGGNMGDINYAAYDPIFYLHHSFVDQQYAFWQEVQFFRGKSTLAKNPNRKMPPFSGETEPPYPNYPYKINPIPSTKEYDSQALGRDYKKNFNYKYYPLTFDGESPEEYYNNQKSYCPKRFQAGFTAKDYTIISINYAIVNYQGQKYNVASHYTIAMSMH